MELLYIFTGIFIGIAAVSVIMWFRSKNRSMFLDERTDLLRHDLEETKKELEKKEASIIELTRELAGEKAQLSNMREKLEHQKKEVESLQEKFRIEFKNLANEILEEKTKKFTEQNREKLGELLKPLGERIKDFEKKVEETYDKEAQQRFSLKEEVKRLAELNQQVSKEAGNLVRALKGESKTRGNWGEFILESILEKSGLVKDREYLVQSSYKADDGSRLQPDVVIKYPGDRSLVIDSKVSLAAYEQYVTSEDENDRTQKLKEHLSSVKNHIKGLSEKNYQDIYELQSLDFVMLFMPIEPAYLLAIHTDAELWSYAYEKRVLLISPTNLIAALKLVANLWRQENQNKNAMEIANQGGALYDKFVAFAEDLEELGRKLDSTKKSYDESINKLKSGKGNLIRRAENIRILGAKTKKIMPPGLNDEGMDE